MKKQIKNTDDLRTTLIETIEKVSRGTMEPSFANAIANLSGKVLMSARLDIETIKLRREMGGDAEPTRVAQLVSTKAK